MLKIPFFKRDATDIRRTAQKALRLYRQGRLSEAEPMCRTVLDVDPQHFDALHLLGIIKMQQGRNDDAAKLIAQSLQVQPKSTRALTDMGIALQALGHHDDALARVDRALVLGANSAEAHALRATAVQSLGRSDEALTSYDRALTLEPDFVPALCGRGNTLRLLGRHAESLVALNKALTNQPQDATIFFAIGQTLQAMNRMDEAISKFDQALALEPDRADVLFNRGNALNALGKCKEAIDDYSRVLELAPNYAGAAYNRGVVLRALGRRDEAIASFDLALTIRPKYPDALHNRGIVLTEVNRHEDALASFESLVAIAPDYSHALGNVAYTSGHVGRWENRDQLVRRIEDGLQRGKPVSVPFVLLALSQDPRAQMDCARSHILKRHPLRASPLWNGEIYCHEKIRVAYLSANFHSHAVAYLLAGLFEQHDRRQFEVTGISFGPDGADAMRSRVAAGFDRFIDVRTKSDADVARLTRQMEIDIAVDLMGHTGDARPDIFAYRPAPAQVNYLGYPGTMGASYIDYILADRFVIPENRRDCYIENVVYLPDTFQANDSKRQSAERTPSRAEVGLPAQGFVFCSFNNGYKITPTVFDIWMRLLHKVENSVLWLFGGNTSIEVNLRREALVRGIESSRLVFAPRLAYPEYLARYRLADLFLDTLPFNAGTTASDALWAGIPVLTCAGEAFAARMAGSLLTAVGLPELITFSLEQYEALAMRLAMQPRLLRDYKERLARNHLVAPLFDTDRFRRHVEAAYTTMWEITQRAQKASGFAVASLPA